MVTPRYAWFRAGNFSVDAAAGTIALTPLGMGTTSIFSTAKPDAPSPLHGGAADAPSLSFSFGRGAVGLREGSAAPSLAQVQATVGAARAARSRPNTCVTAM